MSRVVTGFPLWLVGVLMCLLAYPVQAANERATIRAFEALLSLPQTQPEEGVWGHEAPPGFEGTDESALIEWLKTQKKAGADFNEVRHFGTMLHHAIRGQLEETALWLINNGADPLRTVEDGVHPDALALAVKYRLWSLVEKLLKLSSVRAPERAKQHLLAWHAAVGDDDQGATALLLEYRMPFPAGELSEELLYLALERQWHDVALKLTKGGVTRSRRPQYLYFSPVFGNDDWTPQVFENLDKRLDEPVFAYALVQARSVAQVDQIWQLRMRKSFENNTFTVALLQRIFRMPEQVAVQRRMLERIPIAASLKALEDEELLRQWVLWAMKLSDKDGEWALDAIGDVLRKRSAVVLLSITKNASWFNNHQPDLRMAEGWRRLLRRMPSPLPVAVNGKLWMFVPHQERATLLKLGYHPGEEELSFWLERAASDEIRSTWHLLKVALPELIDSIHEPLLAPFKAGSLRCDNLGLRTITSKSRLLLDAGAKPRKPVLLDAACVREDAKEVLSELEAMGAIAPPVNVSNKRFVHAPLQCHFKPDEIWREVLLTQQKIGDTAVTGVQLVDIPGEDECGLFAWGGNPGGRQFIDDEGFTGTSRLTPCADGSYASELWRKVSGKVQRTQLHEGVKVEGTLPIRDTANNQIWLVGGDIPLGGCGATPMAVLTWGNDSEAGVFLKFLLRSSPSMQALITQCSGKDIWACLDPDPTGGEPVITTVLDAFVDRHWANERQAYLMAVQELDYEALSAMRKRGIPTHWTRQAIEAVTQGSMKLDEKRKRIAWLFRDERLREVMDYQVSNNLIPWLPREDWGPVIKALAGNDWLLKVLDEEAQRHKRYDVACRFATVRKRLCSRPD